MDVVQVLDAIRAHLDADHQPVALAGAFALNAYGLGRATADLDLVVPAGAQAGLIRKLEAMGYETLHTSSGFSNHLHPDPVLGRIDFVYVTEPTASRLFAACRSMPFPGSRDMLVPRPEHLIAMKVQAMKNDPKRRLRDMADIAFLLQRGDVDREEARRYFAEAGLAEDWNELVREG
jgi:hypothetical protein